MGIYRTHNCGELTINNINKEVILSGWIHNIRDHGGVIFIDLRDNYGLIQIVFNESLDSNQLAKITHLHLESVIKITGIVHKRSNENINSHLCTGEIEILVSNFEILSKSDISPFQVNSDEDYNEEIRLKYRFLDLRREKMHKIMHLRSKIIKKMREEMTSRGFYEFNTPILTASSPEGARDYVVPSRKFPGKFYALPQAPQQFKQLLMISGFDRYFQIAPCFRDEDSRSDRAAGDFYQLDIEMSFVEQDDILNLTEDVIFNVFSEFVEKNSILNKKFPKIPYREAMLKYGSDKPDLRNPIINYDVTEIFENSGFSIFADQIKKGAKIRAIPAEKTAEKSRSFFDEMIKFAQKNGAPGLAYIIFDQNNQSKGPIAKLLDENKLQKIQKICKISEGDSVFFTCDIEEKSNKLAGLVRTELGKKLDLINHNEYKFCWIVDFPYFEWNDEKKIIEFSHNPFSMPKCDFEYIRDTSNEDLLKIEAYQYDLVCNGYELSSGAIRNHNLDLMFAAFERCGYSKKEVEYRFQSLVKAFKFGVPPHGGIAPGIERIIMLIAKTENIRDVIPFPLTGRGEDLLMGAPSILDKKQLDELGIVLKKN